jgi:hypothetical protein
MIIEAMQQAIDALKNTWVPDVKEVKAVDALREAIRHMEDQPKESGCAECGCKAEDGWALYCLKCGESQREWVGLTDANIAQLRREGAHSVSDKDFSAIEAKLREKNG